MSNILYINQRQLNQKPIYDPIEFKNMLETADANLINYTHNVVYSEIFQ